MYLFTGVKVKKGEIKNYFTEYYYSAVSLYNRYKRFGMPFTGGWAEQPEYLIDVIDLFDSTIAAHGEYKRKK
jgi:hypothetical protein